LQEAFTGESDSMKINDLGGNVQHVTFETLGKLGLGLGNIGPENRNSEKIKKLPEMQRRVAAREFNIKVESDVPWICVDGRFISLRTRPDAPSGAGGTNGVAYARVLGDTSLLRGVGELEVIKSTTEIMKREGKPVGVHGADHGDCGCGACAEALKIFEHIANNIDKIVVAADVLGVPISPENQSIIVDNASSRLENGFFVPDRSKTLQTARDAGADYEEFVGDHKELIVSVNTIPGTTVSRGLIKKEFGEGYELFVLDAWALPNAAEAVATTGSPEEVDLLTQASVAFNIATASTLGHGSLAIVPVLGQ